jgi:hypothetical protein
MVAVFAIALALEGLAATLQEAQPKSETTAAAPRQSRQRRNRSRAAENRGIPSGMENCLKALMQMAERDPLPEYEGRPEQIINNGMLWTDAKAKCPVGDDQAKRLKLFELAKAWRLKDAAKVRSILQELGATSSGGK